MRAVLSSLPVERWEAEGDLGGRWFLHVAWAASSLWKCWHLLDLQKRAGEDLGLSQRVFPPHLRRRDNPACRHHRPLVFLL